MGEVISSCDDFTQFRGERPDLSNVDRVKLLQDGLKHLAEGAAHGLMECRREVLTGDMQRLSAEQERKRRADSLPSVDKVDRYTDEQHASITDACKALEFSMLCSDLESLWNVMNEIIRFHALRSDPPSWTINKLNRDDIGAISAAYQDLARWVSREQERCGTEHYRAETGKNIESDSIIDPDTQDLVNALFRGLRNGKDVKTVNAEFFKSRPRLNKDDIARIKRNSRNHRVKWDPSHSAET